MNKFKLRILALLILLIVFFGFIIFWMPNTFEGDRFIIVSKGENYSQIADSLYKAGILHSRTTFILAGRLSGTTTKMQIGKYRFKSGVTNMQILNILQNGTTIEEISVSIPEGLTATKQGKILERHLRIDYHRFIKLIHDSSFAKSLGIPNKTCEGYLMPSTYKFHWQMEEEEIIEKMVRNFWSDIDESLQSEIKKRKLSLNEIITMASIIEAETSVDSERAIIAGVYYNRIQKKMHLNADPTIQYILGDSPRRLYYSDLKKKSPYNTYLHYGLPPGPINNPGKASIIAALRPKKHKYLYFVADGLGGHTFSRIYSEHQQAIRQYKKIREEQRALKDQEQ